MLSSWFRDRGQRKVDKAVPHYTSSHDVVTNDVDASESIAPWLLTGPVHECLFTSACSRVPVHECLFMY